MQHPDGRHWTAITFVDGCSTIRIKRSELRYNHSKVKRHVTRTVFFVRRRRVVRGPCDESSGASGMLVCLCGTIPSDESASIPSYVIHSDSDDDDDDAYMTRYVPSSPITPTFTKKPLPMSESSPRKILTEKEEKEPVLLGPDPPFLEDCNVCKSTGFVPCSKCDAEGFIRNPRSKNAFYCPVCVGHKKVRCPSCGGKCYMC